VGGNPELIKNGYNGLLVPKENSDQLAAALEDLIKDKQKRQIMGANGFSLINEKFSMQSMLDHYEKVLQ
jgi:glycosyltransferase involved in cell wall biosynthesis